MSRGDRPRIPELQPVSGVPRWQHHGLLAHPLRRPRPDSTMGTVVRTGIFASSASPSWPGDRMGR